MSKSFGNVGRPAGLDGRVRLRRRPLHPGPRRQPRCRRADRRGLGPGVPQLRQQDLERHALRADERRDGRGPAARPVRDCRRRTAGSSPGSTRSSPRSTRTTRTTSSRSSPTPSTTSRGTRSSTGTSSCPRPPSSRAASRPRSRGRVLGEVLDVMLRLLHPVVPFVTETLWTTLTGGESVVIADWPARQRLPGRGGRAGDRARSSRSSPRSAGSAPTRACSRASGSRPGWPWTAPQLAAARGGHPPAAAAPAGGRGLHAPPRPCRSRAPRSRWTCPARSTSRPSASG